MEAAAGGIAGGEQGHAASCPRLGRSILGAGKEQSHSLPLLGVLPLCFDRLTCKFMQLSQSQAGEERGLPREGGGFSLPDFPNCLLPLCPAVGMCGGVERRSLGPGRELTLLFLVTAGESRPEQPDGNATLGSGGCVCEDDPGCTPPSCPEPGSSLSGSSNSVLPARHPGLSAKGLQMLCY